MPPRRSRRRDQEPTAPEKRKLPVVSFEELADFNESINIALYGDSGVGKTPFAAQAPNAVILSTEKGSISAKRFGSKAELIRATTWDHVEAALDLIDARQRGEVKGKSRLEWMIVDSVTKMQVLQIRWILERIHEIKEDRDLDIPAIADHQKWQNMFKRFIDRIVDMDINVIFVATAMHKEDEEGEPLVLPDIQGKDYAIAQYLCAQCDAVYCLKSYLDKKTDEPFWKLLTRRNPPYFAKDRYDSLPAVVVRPTMPEVVAAIQESGEYNAAQKAFAAKRSAARARDEDDEEEPESPTQRKPRTPARKPARSQRRAVEQDPEPEDDDEPEFEGTRMRGRKPAKRPARKAKVEEEPPDEDEFDPDEEDDDIDFDDEE